MLAAAVERRNFLGSNPIRAVEKVGVSLKWSEHLARAADDMLSPELLAALKAVPVVFNNVLVACHLLACPIFRDYVVLKDGS